MPDSLGGQLVQFTVCFVVGKSLVESGNSVERGSKRVRRGVLRRCVECDSDQRPHVRLDRLIALERVRRCCRENQRQNKSGNQAPGVQTKITDRFSALSAREPRTYLTNREATGRAGLHPASPCGSERAPANEPRERSAPA